MERNFKVFLLARALVKLATGTDIMPDPERKPWIKRSGRVTVCKILVYKLSQKSCCRIVVQSRKSACDFQRTQDLSFLKQHFLNFLPLPQGQGELRPILPSSFCTLSILLFLSVSAAASNSCNSSLPIDSLCMN